jgi:hypothetical protein
MTFKDDVYFHIWRLSWIETMSGGGHRGRDRMIVGYIITNAISAYHH